MKKKRPARAGRPKPAPPSTVLRFAAHDSHHHRKNSLWYVGIGLLFVAVLAALYQAGEYLLMAVAGAAVLALFRLADLGVRERDIQISEHGVTFGDEFWSFFQLRAFWAAEHADSVSIYIERLNWAPTVHFIVPHARAEEVVQLLADHLPWHDHRSEPLGDRLGRLLRF